MIILLWLKLVFIKRILYNFKKLKNMKLRNLLFGTMIACAFVACSNDDDPVDNGGNNSNLNGKTLLQVSPNLLKTKADSEGFTICVIDQNNTVVAKGLDNTVIELPTEAEGSVEIVALKNSVDITKGTTRLDNLTAKINFTTGTEEVSGTESMNTAYFKVSIERGKFNTLGFSKEDTIELAKAKNVSEDNVKLLSNNQVEPIPAYRNIAQIYVEAIKLSDNEAFKKKYPDAKFTPKRMYLLNGRAQAFASVHSFDRWAQTEDKDGTSYIGGFASDIYNGYYDEAVKQDPDKEYIYVKEAPKTYQQYIDDSWESSTTLNSGYARDLKNGNGKYETLPRKITDGNTNHFVPEGVNCFYTYENTNEKTPVLLVVQGDFTYKDASSGAEIKAENHFYTIVVGKTINASSVNYGDFGFDSLDEFNSAVSLVRRNIQYLITLTVSGPGAVNPFIPGSAEDTYLEATVKLVNYGKVYQEEDID